MFNLLVLDPLGFDYRFATPRGEAHYQDVCPACRRIEDGLPAGILTLHGDFARRHENEILNLARHEEAAEKSEHPLNRIMGIADTPEGLVIDTTDVHLPRRLGDLQRGR